MRRLLALSSLPFVVVAFIAIAWLESEAEAVDADSRSQSRECPVWTGQ